MYRKATEGVKMETKTKEKVLEILATIFIKANVPIVIGWIMFIAGIVIGRSMK